MSEQIKTYTLVTLQDIVDKVPSERIRDCLSELAEVLVSAKASVELLHMVAVALAKKDGKTIPMLEPGARIVKLPPLEWIDDGKGEIEAHMMKDADTELFTVKNGKIILTK